MSTTPYLGIPLLATQQQQPNVTHNEALYLIQALLNGVVSIGSNTPPGSPVAGNSYVVGTAPTGAWAGRANTIAIYTDGGWRFVPDRDDSGTPLVMGANQHGMRAYNRTDDLLYVWDGSAWVTI